MKNSTFLIVLSALLLSFATAMPASNLHFPLVASINSTCPIVPKPNTLICKTETAIQAKNYKNNDAICTRSVLNQTAAVTAVAASTADLHYIWLNLTGANGLFCQMAFGYRPEATNGVDDYDATRIDGQFTLNTLIDSSANDYVIQGRAFPFTVGDVVHLSAKFPVSGTFTISIDHTMGMFLNGQDIILRDKLTGATHNLASSGYTFTAAAGYFTSRFDIVYQNALANVATNYQNEVVVYKNSAALVVDAANQIISEITVYDLQGRLICKKSNVNASTFELTIASNDKLLIVNTMLEQGTVITKKVIQ